MKTTTIGQENIFEIQIGGYVDGSSGLCFVDIFISGEKITFNDNIGFIDSLISAAEYDLYKKRDLKDIEAYSDLSVSEIHCKLIGIRKESLTGSVQSEKNFMNHQVLDWGPNTDEVFCFLVSKDGESYLTFSFLNKPTSASNVHTVKIDKDVFFKTIDQFICCLKEKMD